MKENQQISMVMRVVKFITILKYILHRDRPNHANGDEFEDDVAPEAPYIQENEETFEVILRKSIADQLPDDLEGNQDLAELIRRTYYESIGIEDDDDEEAEHLSDE